MNKTDLLLQMMEQPQHYTAEEWQEILADEECRELYTLMSKTQSAIDATRADQEVTDDMIDAEWQRLSDEKQEVRNDKYSLLKFAAMFVGILMLQALLSQPSTSPVIITHPRNRKRKSSRTLNLQLPVLNSLSLTR